MMRLLPLALVALAASPPLMALEPANRLSGTYAFGGRTLVDPPPGEPRNTHLYVVLEGSAARELYRRMNARAVRDECLDDGSLAKTVGRMQCTQLAHAKGYTCAFSLNLAEQKIEGGVVC
jgi:hypothetical protein